MSTTIKIKNSIVADRVPASSAIEKAELAINLTDRKLYSKDQNDEVFEIQPTPTGEVPGGGTADRPGTPNVGDLFYDTDVDGLLYWNGTSWEQVLTTSEGGYWQRAGTTLSPATAGDDLSVDGDVSVGGKATSTSTIDADAGTTLATKDYVDAAAASGVWTRDDTTTTLYPTDGGDGVGIGGVLPSAPNINLSANGTGSFTGKVTSASTETTDAGTTLATKDYVDANSGGSNQDAVQLSNSDIDCSQGNYFYYIATVSNFTPKFNNVPAAPAVYSVTIEVTNNKPSFLIDWFQVNVKWPDDNTPDAPLSSYTGLYMLVTRDGGSTWFGSAITSFR